MARVETKTRRDRPPSQGRPGPPCSAPDAWPGRRLPIAAAAVLLASVTAAAQPSAGEGSAAAWSYIPPWLESGLVYYNPFEGDPRQPPVNRLGAETVIPRGLLAAGLAGAGLQDPRPAGSEPLVTLRSAALTPDRPLTLAVWWRLDAPMAAETCFHLLTLSGAGMVSNFVRGKGEWCALAQPTYVLQVYNYEGIANINEIWRGDAWVEPQVWHHTAIVFRHAAEVDVYWDGVLRSHHAIRGRSFAAGDGGTLAVGPHWLFHPMTLDDLVVLDRALSADEVAAYVLAVQRMRSVGFPLRAGQ